MTRAVLTLNAGSSSLKFALYTADALRRRLAVGQLEGIGTHPHLIIRDEAGHTMIEWRWKQADALAAHAEVLAQIIGFLHSNMSDLDIVGVGHRVVHGGPIYEAPVVIDEDVMANLVRFTPLAPLHQPHNITGIRAAIEAFPGVPQVACFDTAFHRRHPWVADTYGLPYSLWEEGVRRYGFHGLSYEAVWGKLVDRAPEMATSGRAVVAHLGSGASMCAVKAGRSVGSTMGFSTVDGLPMSTRSGSIDPGVLLWMMQEKGWDAAQITKILYKESGLKGLSGISGDMRDLERSDAPGAKRAIDFFVFRVKREICAMTSVLGGLDAVVFTGGIGEHSALVRARAVEGLEFLGVEIDHAANAVDAPVISMPHSGVTVHVIPTDEEGVIAHHTSRLIAL
ncbi:acetate/propionate family kinase [Pinisolibacter aquiterrae]|uniref:acetate/propionate family kinase n=1 Tax=Pinisolibacter aquiterrae TaxID=2815579 RepID=UPI001C3CCE77|nr:acetate/propionate family kinase [Pinisolibacter aquiterrae]